MHPLLFEIGGFQVHTYGFMGAIGFLALVSVALWRARRLGLNADRVVDVIFWTSLASIAGSRLVYVAQNPEQFDGFWSIVNIRTGGLVFYGALVTGLPVGGLLMKRYGLPFYKLMDIFATAFPIGHALTRLGCFAAGCCHGSPAPNSPLAVTFSDPTSAVAPSLLNVPLYPTQLFEVGYNLLIFGVCNWYYGRKKFDGQVMLLYLTLYAVTRSINEVFRGDVTRGYFLPGVLGETLSYSQGVSIVVAFGAFAVFLVGARQAAERQAAREKRQAEFPETMAELEAKAEANRQAQADEEA